MRLGFCEDQRLFPKIHIFLHLASDFRFYLQLNYSYLTFEHVIRLSDL